MPEGRVTRQRTAAAAAKKPEASIPDPVPEASNKKSTTNNLAKKSVKAQTKPSAKSSARDSQTTTTDTGKPSTSAKPKPKDATKASTTKVSTTKASKPKVSSSSPSISTSTTPKRYRKMGPVSDMEKALAALRKSQEEASKIRIEDIRELKKEFNKAVDQAKRTAQLQEEREAIKKPAKSTRSGLKRGALKKIDEYTLGKVILYGMRDAKNTFADDELEFLGKKVATVKEVKDLKFEHLQYLVSYVFLPELKGIQKGEIKSAFHDRYNEMIGKNKNELYSEMRLTLFTNEQRDYLNGYLQEVFGANKKDERGDINHTLINYVELVMLYETTLRIVKFVHKFSTYEETLAFMKKKSREAYGISDDEDD